ncbi:MAG TPA: hypothetical protein VF692_03230, partial [Pyrinomonadaceae bacterium]
MPKASIYVLQSDGYAICLRGVAQTDKIIISSLDLKANRSGTASPAASPELMPFAAGESFEINRNQLTKITDVGSGAAAEEHFKFSIADLNLTFTANLLFAAGNKRFFGKNFSVDAGYSARLVLRLVADATLNLEPSAMIEFCGQIEVDLGGGTFQVSTTPLCFQIDLEKLFDGNPANFKLPSLRIALPDFGFSLPKLPVHWDFPNLPPFPFGLPGQQFPFENLPIEISWKSAKLSEDAGKISADVIGLR